MAYCDKCGNFDDEHTDGEPSIMSLHDYQPNLYFYWNGDIEEDYTMPNDYQCLCEICFDIFNQEGKIAWKDNNNPFKCA